MESSTKKLELRKPQQKEQKREPDSGCDPVESAPSAPSLRASRQRQRLPSLPGAVSVAGIDGGGDEDEFSDCCGGYDEEQPTIQTPEVLISAVKVREEDVVEASADQTGRQKCILYFVILILLLLLTMSVLAIKRDRLGGLRHRNKDSNSSTQADNVFDHPPANKTDDDEQPVAVPTAAPSESPTEYPTASQRPSLTPSIPPSLQPSAVPTSFPSSVPTRTLEWRQMGQTLVGNTAGDFTGRTVALSKSGLTMAYGTHLNPDLTTLDSGYVRVVEYDMATNEWYPIGQDIYGFERGDYNGWAVDLSANGRVVAVSAWTYGFKVQGLVRVYGLSSLGKWVQIGQTIIGDQESLFLGGSVALSDDGETIAIGADLADEVGIDSGRVQVFRYSNVTSEWNELGQVISGVMPLDQAGWDVDLSGDGTVLAVAANRRDGENGEEDVGHVRVYNLVTGACAWFQLGDDMWGESPLDMFGHAVSLSHDGKRVAVSGIKHDEEGSVNAGHVKVYEYNDSTEEWDQLGQDINGNEPFLELGLSVSLSEDGNILAIGSDTGAFQLHKYNPWNAEWNRIDRIVENANTTRAVSVSLNGEGDIVALGYPQANGNIGAVKVLRYEDP